MGGGEGGICGVEAEEWSPRLVFADWCLVFGVCCFSVCGFLFAAGFLWRSARVGDYKEATSNLCAIFFFGPSSI